MEKKRKKKPKTNHHRSKIGTVAKEKDREKKYNRRIKKSNFCQFHCCRNRITKANHRWNETKTHTHTNSSHERDERGSRIELRAMAGYWENPLLNINRIKNFCGFAICPNKHNSLWPLIMKWLCAVRWTHNTLNTLSALCLWIYASILNQKFPTHQTKSNGNEWILWKLHN